MVISKAGKVYMQRMFSVFILEKLSMTRYTVVMNPQGADPQTKPDGKLSQPVNMVQLLTVRPNSSVRNEVGCSYLCIEIESRL